MPARVSCSRNQPPGPGVGLRRPEAGRFVWNKALIQGISLWRRACAEGILAPVESLFSSCFHPLTAKWFSETFGSPTDIQVKAWERIAGGDHLLVSAPTGSGKTLAAFLWPLDRLVSGAWEGSGTRVLYVSPLKALNTDIRENLLTPLKGISAAFRGSGTDHRQVSVSLRSGDTGQPERRRLLVHPPDILITTPESLNILLSTLNGKALLGNLRLVILDEIIVALYFELISLNEIVQLVQGRAPHVEVVLTGRYAPPELIEVADLVTEMKNIKHYYQAGVAAREGIES